MAAPAQNAATVCDFRLGGAAGDAPSSGDHSHSHSHEQSHSHEHSHDHTQRTTAAAVQEHGHTHDFMDHPGKFTERAIPDHSDRDWNQRAWTVGIGG